MTTAREDRDDQVASVAAEDATELEALYRAEAPAMVRLAAVLVSDRVVAEELVQDAFLRIQPRLAGLENPRAYLRTTVVNLCRSHGRHQAVVARTPLGSPGWVEPAELPAELGPAWLAAQRLPERQRVALTLRLYLDLADEQIAAHLGCRPGTVRSLISRGLSTLRKELAP